jgi:CBS domain-containing protein
VAASPLLDRRTTLKDALSLMLDADVQAGIVADRRGRALGIVTVEDISTWMRDTGTRGPSDAPEATGIPRAARAGASGDGPGSAPAAGRAWVAGRARGPGPGPG